MIKIVLASERHVDLIEPKRIFTDDPNWRGTHRAAVKSWPAYTFLNEEGAVLAIIGFTRLYRTTGEVWALTSDRVKECPVSFTRAAKNLLESYTREHRLTRVQMVVRNGCRAELRWAKHLGFQVEGLMYKYGPEGDDYIMMGRV